MKKYIHDDVDIMPYIADFLKFIVDDLKIDLNPLPELILRDEKSDDIFGKTGYYDPENNKVVAYTDGRKFLDIMRTISHELTHRMQDVKGQLDKHLESDLNDPHYASHNKALLKLEEEAYKNGGIWVRLWREKTKLNKTNDKKLTT